MRFADKRGLRLFRAFKACNLKLRNWSAPGDWRFAVYEYDDTYVGCVCLDDTTDQLTLVPNYKLAKRELARLTELCRVHTGTVV